MPLRALRAVFALLSCLSAQALIDVTRQGKGRGNLLFSAGSIALKQGNARVHPPTPIPSCLFARSVKQKKSEVHSPTESQDSFRCLFSMTLLTVNSSGVRLAIKCIRMDRFQFTILSSRIWHFSCHLCPDIQQIIYCFLFSSLRFFTSMWR